MPPPPAPPPDPLVPPPLPPLELLPVSVTLLTVTLARLATKIAPPSPAPPPAPRATVPPAPPAALAFVMVRSWIATVTGTWLEPENAPTNRPRNWLLPDSVLLLPSMVTFFCTAGRSAVSVILVLKMMRSPLAALVIALRNCASVPTTKSVAQAGPAATGAESALMHGPDPRAAAAGRARRTLCPRESCGHQPEVAGTITTCETQPCPALRIRRPTAATPYMLYILYA